MGVVSAGLWRARSCRTHLFANGQTGKKVFRSSDPNHSDTFTTGGEPTLDVVGRVIGIRGHYQGTIADCNHPIQIDG
ncbi:hypothetical protein NPIL_56431 [Nephila pilipes]|uniref:Uncharacterized protein n=1 Tax=Nephila pilipes TaxID=299642 RepID=A0A8X6NX57_NEPPI|nr:hypothetical protein NPIL_56431 [Nephila pilipes]